MGKKRRIQEASEVVPFIMGTREEPGTRDERRTEANTPSKAEQEKWRISAAPAAAAAT